MKERLALLSADLSALEGAAGAVGRVVSGAGAPAETPTSDSLAALMEQALQSGDDVLLEQCLRCEDADVIAETVRRLALGRVVSLLRRLVAKFEKRPARGTLLTRWLASILRSHTTFLITVPDLSGQLAGLFQLLEQRLASYSRLSALGGRLDLLMAQISSRADTMAAGGSSTAEDRLASHIPAAVHVEE
jgi:U3 small nucleolar RNA-associated protein 5